VQRLTDTLREQHRKLEHCATALTTALHGDELPTITMALDDFRTVLEEHLTLEDGELYPRLLSAAEPRSEPARIAKTFSENMQRISAGLRDFLQRHTQGSLDPLALRREWKEAQSVLVARIQSEERLLFPMYEQRFGVRP
jgi:iron-sulfur cluster repair protein YtfE (RIC family)